ncbi:MAG: glycosyltransferase family 2 protein [bacterium]
MQNSKNIASVVITYNRLGFLKEVIGCLREQTLRPAQIIIVNNGSTDGTKEWLASQSDLFVIEQENVGSSGGQFTGIKAAFDMGFEWIWTMDDDVLHEPNCLEKLFNNITINRIHAPLRYDIDGKPFLNDVKYFNLKNPFKSLWQGIFDEEVIKQDYISAQGITFEGPLFHRSLIEKIGLPDKNFFIYGDDTEYFIRAYKSGFSIFIIRDARSNRKLPFLESSEKFTWKHYYVIRNIIAIDVMHGNFAVRTLRPLGYFLKWIFRSRSYEDLIVSIKALKDGYFYKRIIPHQ